MATNFIPDTNKFLLPEPPEWFMQGLFDYDPLLVLVPSRVKVLDESPAYLLCRRRLHSAGIGDVAMLDNLHPDTNMCYAHNLVPIGPLRFNNGASTFTANSLASLLADLKSRDTWAISGGPDGDSDKVWQAVELAELQQKQAQRAALKDGFYHRARDAYRSLKARTGQRNKRASDHHGVAPTPKSQGVILTDAT